MTVTDHIRARILRCLPAPKMPGLEELRRTEWCPGFERLRANRLVMGAFRYGRLGAEGKPLYARASCMQRRLEDHKRDGNAEHLVDVANLAMLEYVEGKHNGIIHTDDGEHTRRIG